MVRCRCEQNRRQAQLVLVVHVGRAPQQGPGALTVRREVSPAEHADKEDKKGGPHRFFGLLLSGADAEENGGASLNLLSTEPMVSGAQKFMAVMACALSFGPLY